MRAPRLDLVLVLVIAGLLATATAAVTVSASRFLSATADERALASAGFAATSVVDAVRHRQDDLAATAALLAERPTLRRLLATNDRPGLVSFLGQFRSTAKLEAAWILEGAVTLAGSGEPIPSDLLPPPSARAPALMHLESDGPHVLLVAFAEVPGRPGTTVAVAARVEPARLAGPSGTPAPSVALLDRDALARRIDSARSGLRNEALSAGAVRAGRVGDSLVAVASLRSGGEIVGLVEAEVSRSAATGTVRHWIRDVRRVALTIVIVAAGIGLALGRHLARPLGRLTVAAERIGLGDLETPVPRAPGREAGTLARVMEEMRLRLVDSASQLRLRQAESEAVLGGIAEGVIAVDANRHLRYLSPRAAGLLGVKAEDVHGRFCGDVLRPAIEDGVRPCDQRCPILRARAGTPGQAVEHLQPAGAAPRTVVLTSSVPVEGRQILLLREETELETTRRLRDTVVANISHEFKTPLAAQLASIELLRDRIDALSADEARTLLLAIERGAIRLTRLVDNLLESVRLDSGEASIRRKRVALDEIVEEAVEAMRPLIAQKGQTLDVELPHPLPAITGDATRLVQVVVNLLANANKFAPEGSSIRVGATSSSSSVTLFIADDGPGLPDGDDLFARFVRRAGDEPEQSGMGLGLWISRSIVERHGGRLFAAPVASGTKMCIVLPGSPA